MKEKISLKPLVVIIIIILPLIYSLYGFKGNDAIEALRLSVTGEAKETEIKQELESEKVAELEVQEASETDATEISLTPENRIIVDISGAVESPGVYMLQDGSRIFDLIEAAGGLTKDADINYINRAEILFDEAKIYIPSVRETSDLSPGSAVRSSSVSSGPSLININTADSETLQKIPGVGPSTAEKIISYRLSHGRFSSIEELTNIPGIGAKTLEKMKGYITAR